MSQPAMETSSTQAEPPVDSTWISPTWIWDTASNVHVAQHRSWFSTDYMPLSTFIRRLDTGERVDVIGVGTVRLPTKASPHLPSSASHTTLFLQRVLHAPNLQVNLIGQTGLENWKAVPRDYDGHTCGYIYDSTNKPVAFFKPTAPPGVFEVRISGPPVGPPVGKRPSHLLVYNHNLSHYWFPGERKSVEAWLDIRDRNFAIDGPLTKMELAWLAACFGDKFPVMKELGSNMFRAIFRNEARVILRDLASCSDSHPSLPPGSELLTPIELRWFTDRYGAMFKALGARGVRLFRPEYQAEGRSILRTIMYNDGFNFSSDSASQQSATTPSHDEQVWLKMQSKDFDKFLSEHALIMYNDEDRNEGLCILRSLMRDNGDLDSESSSNRNNILAEKLESEWLPIVLQPPELRKYRYHKKETFAEQDFARRFICYNCRRIDFHWKSDRLIWSTIGSGEIFLPAGFSVVTTEGKARIY